MSLSTPAIWIDGERANALPLPDRGLDFGDGLFETLLVVRGIPLFADLHLERLALGARRLGFPQDALAGVHSCLAPALAAVGEAWDCAALRLTLTRGSAPRGYAPPELAIPRVIASASPLDLPSAELPRPLDVGLCDIRYSVQPLLAGIKHLNRLEQVMAAAEARTQGLDEVVMLDLNDQVRSLSAANIFMLESATLVTPPLRDCGILGTRRRLLVERWSVELGIAVLEQDFSLARLLAADEVFCTSSLRGVQPVGRIGARRWSEFPLCSAIHARYVRELPC
ncbi:aminodeoxychorismate lyase [Haliea sp. E17]|uniref:aminodeoxychorismate lyase n=1 Tax=Haliea sp. E17 TaxID=3401576 RepID=UPI003AABB2D7